VSSTSVAPGPGGQIALVDIRQGAARRYGGDVAALFRWLDCGNHWYVLPQDSGVPAHLKKSDRLRAAIAPTRENQITMTNESTPLRVLVAEDNEDLRAVMPPLIEESGDLHCVATTDSLDELADLIERHAVQVAVLDIELRGGSALKALPALSARFPATRFLIHSGHSNPEMIRKAREAGAAGYVLKSGDPDDLVAAIRKLQLD
jgi:CheY-like chemotaxis protein